MTGTVFKNLVTLASAFTLVVPNMALAQDPETQQQSPQAAPEASEESTVDPSETINAELKSDLAAFIVARQQLKQTYVEAAYKGFLATVTKAGVDIEDLTETDKCVGRGIANISADTILQLQNDSLSSMPESQVTGNRHIQQINIMRIERIKDLCVAEHGFDTAHPALYDSPESKIQAPGITA